MDLTARFADLVTGDEARLDEGALLIAAHAQPGLDIAAECSRLDDLARGCSSSTLEGLRQYLFEELGFRGDVQHYDDPANSYLNLVLDRRRGIPITLSVVTMEVARRVGLRLAGVGMPGHFLVRSLDEPELFIDAFDGGRFLAPSDCRSIFERVQGSAVMFRPEFLSIVDQRSILLRMLNNLRASFIARNRFRDLAWVLELQLAFAELPVVERRRTAALLGSVGCLDRAADHLEHLVDELPDSDADRVRRQANALRARLN